MYALGPMAAAGDEPVVVTGIVAAGIGDGVAGVSTTGLAGADVAADEVGAHAVKIKAALTKRSNAVQRKRRDEGRDVSVFKCFMFVLPF